MDDGQDGQADSSGQSTRDLATLRLLTLAPTSPPQVPTHSAPSALNSQPRSSPYRTSPHIINFGILIHSLSFAPPSASTSALGLCVSSTVSRLPIPFVSPLTLATCCPLSTSLLNPLSALPSLRRIVSASLVSRGRQPSYVEACSHPLLHTNICSPLATLLDSWSFGELLLRRPPHSLLY